MGSSSVHPLLKFLTMNGFSGPGWSFAETRLFKKLWQRHCRQRRENRSNLCMNLRKMNYCFLQDEKKLMSFSLLLMDARFMILCDPVDIKWLVYLRNGTISNIQYKSLALTAQITSSVSNYIGLDKRKHMLRSLSVSNPATTGPLQEYGVTENKCQFISFEWIIFST